MKKETIVLVVGVIALAVGTFLTVRPIQPKNNGDDATQKGRNQVANSDVRQNKENCLADDCLLVDDLTYPVDELSDEVITSLNKAIDDEYKAYSTYDAVIEKFGEVRPFIMIRRAEEQHISSLKAIYDKYSVDIPENPYLGKITAPDTAAEACSIGVQAEIENAALYKDELLPTVQSYEDIKLVFINLMTASEEKHLPAFQNCSN